MTTRPLALVTGASSGIGRDLARQLAARGHDLVLVARSRDKLEELARSLEAEHKIAARVVTADLAAPDGPSQVKAALDGAPVDVLVNNAGYATFGEFAQLPLDGELSMIQVNVAALVQLTRLFLPEMVARKSGRILNVASTAAFQPGPLMAVYYASKAFVLSFSEAIAEELDGTGVTVTALCPGPTESGFQGRAQMESSKLVRGKKLMTSDEVARLGIEAMLRGRRVRVTGAMNRIMASSVRFLPRRTVTKLVRAAQSPA
jgi:short-subunit dehydrogenase